MAQTPLTQRDWDDAHLINTALIIHADDPAFGYRFIADELPARGIVAGENRVARLCSQERIWSTFAKKPGLNRKSGPPFPDDLVDRQSSAVRRDEVWLTDITEHRTDEGKLYLCAIEDVYSNRIVGYSINSRMKASLAVSALDHAIATRSPVATIVHSDRGAKADSTGRRNTPMWRCRMVRCQQAADRAVRLKLRSPGHPKYQRPVEVGFWKQIAKGLLAEEAAGVVGVAQAVGARWFHNAGGMARFDLNFQPSGRYLSFAEREDIALLRAQDEGIREIARAIGRDPSTISRELRRNAATRSGELQYRASVAQWKADLAARRPKAAKLVVNPQLHAYVQQRFSGTISQPDGTVVT